MTDAEYILAMRETYNDLSHVPEVKDHIERLTLIAEKLERMDAIAKRLEDLDSAVAFCKFTGETYELKPREKFEPVRTPLDDYEEGN